MGTSPRGFQPLTRCRLSIGRAKRIIPRECARRGMALSRKQRLYYGLARPQAEHYPHPRSWYDRGRVTSYIPEGGTGHVYIGDVLINDIQTEGRMPRQDSRPPPANSLGSDLDVVNRAHYSVQRADEFRCASTQLRIDRINQINHRYTSFRLYLRGADTSTATSLMNIDTDDRCRSGNPVHRKRLGRG